MALGKCQFDRAIGLLEASVDRNYVRDEIADILTVTVPSKNSLDTHNSILQLSTDYLGTTKLVTTNFDNLFQFAVETHTTQVKSFAAPLLPIPRRSWNGIVHLHGLIDNSLDDLSKKENLDNLVITSGDFGRAYLFERWAARFVSELFRRYNICFVGYSIDDPILRYMVDASALNKGEEGNELNTFALCEYNKKSKETCVDYWRAKNVVPIPYSSASDHEALHRTLSIWAMTYRTGTFGKSNIIRANAKFPPLVVTKQDDHVGRILWAISDPSGRPAKTFAELNPPPKIEWLKVFSENRFNRDDLPSFGVEPDANTRSPLTFSLIHRPTPSSSAYNMSLFRRKDDRNRWDDVMRQICKWLLRHLDNPELFLWIIKNGKELHPEMKEEIQHFLYHLKLGKSSQSIKFATIRNSMETSPRPAMIILWNLYLTGRVGSNKYIDNNVDIQNLLKEQGINASTRVKLIELLTPKLQFSSTSKLLDYEVEVHNTPKAGQDTVTQIVEGKLILSCSEPLKIVNHLKRNDKKNWKKMLLDLLPVFTFLLNNALDLLSEIGMANENVDNSCSYKPSISNHEQNQFAQDWTVLVDLVRDAWLVQVEFSVDQARSTAESWAKIQYPLFMRLAFFAATYEKVVHPKTSIEWLLGNNSKWLWSTQTRREVMRLLATLPHCLSGNELAMLAKAILSGPTLHEDINRKERDSQVIHRLRKMRFENLNLEPYVMRKFEHLVTQLNQSYKRGALPIDESDEFPVLRGVSYMRERATFHDIKIDAPYNSKELRVWMKSSVQSDFEVLKQWNERCKNDFKTTFSTLRKLTNENFSTVAYWRVALFAWTETNADDVVSLCAVSSFLSEISDSDFKSLVLHIGFWAARITEIMRDNNICELRYRTVHYKLISKILKCKAVKDLVVGGDHVLSSLNHPYGNAAKAALQLCVLENLKPNQGLPARFKRLFSSLHTTEDTNYFAVTTILSSSLVMLFQIDSTWTQKYILRNFKWKFNKNLAAHAWAGFLYSPRYHFELMNILKNDFITASKNHSLLSIYVKAYWELMTYFALTQDPVFKKNELSKVTKSLPSDGLVVASQTILEVFVSIDKKQKMIHLEESIIPYLSNSWPKHNSNISTESSAQISENLARICLKSMSLFNVVFDKVKFWLTKVNFPQDLIIDLNSCGQCKNFPDQSLSFLHKIIAPATYNSSTPFRYADDLDTCLKEIIYNNQNLYSHPNHISLLELIPNASYDNS